jgi:predicted AAA+ superfamily ATPase
MDILIILQAFDQNKKAGFPKKDRKFHITDPFIYRALLDWVANNAGITLQDNEPGLVEATVASHLSHYSHAYYFKGQAEIDVISVFPDRSIQAFEVKWTLKTNPKEITALNKLLIPRNKPVSMER